MYTHIIYEVEKERGRGMRGRKKKGGTCGITKGHEWKQKKIVKVLKKKSAKKRLHLWSYKRATSGSKNK